MSDCGDISWQIDLLVDGELTGTEEAELRAHLANCERCRQELDAALALSAAIRLEMLQPPSAELRNRIETILGYRQRVEGTSQEPQQAEQSQGMLQLVPTIRHGVFAHFGMSVAAGVAVIVSLLFAARYEHNKRRATDFFLAAIAEHQDLVSGKAPLEISSTSPEVVTAWFSPQMPFRFRMPNSGRASEDRAKYVLAGGRVTSFQGKRAALLAYKMASETISILVAPEGEARAIGGTVFYSDAIEFHSMDVDHHHVVTWDTKGLTYALVSDQPMEKRSCSACHMEAGRVEPRQARVGGSMLRVLETPSL